MSTDLRFAVLGNPIKHSYSPSLHQLFAQQNGIEIVYDKIAVPEDKFKSFVQTFFAEGGTGLNITVPFKTEAFDLSRAHLSSRAELAGAVNTLWQQDGQLHGCNTDGIGLVKDIQRLGIEIKDSRILIIGAGGAARGAIKPLLDAGCRHLHIANRTPAKAHQLMQTFAPHTSGSQEISAGSLSELPLAQDIVINASSSSLSGEAPDLPKGLFSPQRSLGYDMLYNADNDTVFLKKCRELGASQTQDGLGMLVYQGAESFRIWLNKTVNAEPVIAHLRQSMLSGL